MNTHISQEKMVNYQREMQQMRHIIADYIMPTPLPLLLTDFVLFNTGRNYNANYQRWLTQQENELKDKFDKKEIQKKDYDAELGLVRHQWTVDFSNGMMEFFHLRYLGSSSTGEAYYSRFEYITLLFSDILGERKEMADIKDIVRRFFDLLKDYLLRNVLGIEGVDEESSCKEVMTACRERYDFVAAIQLTSMEEYIDFQKVNYTKGLIEFADELSVNYEKNEVCDYFLILTECLYVLFAYIYMCEFIIFSEHDSGKYPNLLVYMKNKKY